MFSLRRTKAQSTAEYVIVLGLIVAAVVAMQTYIKRGFQGRLKDAVDFVDQGEQTGGDVVSFSGSQYEPYYLTSTFNTTRNTDETENLLEGGEVQRDTNERTSRAGSQNMQAYTGAD